MFRLQRPGVEVVGEGDRQDTCVQGGKEVVTACRLAGQRWALAIGSRVEKAVEGLLHWWAFPSAFQWPLATGLAVVVFLALRTPRHSELNPGAAIVWQLWWAFLPFFILLTARLWCGVCPVPALGDAARRLRPTQQPLPPSAMRREGPWVAALGLGVMGFLFLLLNLENSGPLTAALLLAFSTVAVGSALLWKGNVWCRYLCPLGLMAGLYSRVGWLRLEPGDKRKAGNTARHCDFFTSPLASRRSHDCALCGACIKADGGEGVNVRLAGTAFFMAPLARAEAVAVSLLLGLLVADALRMTPLFVRFMAWMTPRIGNYETGMALGMALVIALVLMGQAGAARLLGGKGEFWPSFTVLSLAWIPLALAAHLSLSAQHLLAVGDVVRNLGAELSLLTPGHMPPTDAYATLWSMRAFQWAALALGGMAAFYLSRRPSTRAVGGAWALAGIFPAIPLMVIFGQPMSISC